MAGISQPGLHAVNTANTSIISGETNGHGASVAPSTSLPGYPSVVQNTPDTYISRLLEENGNPKVETSPIEEGGGHGGGTGGHGTKEDKNKLLKWAVGLLVAGALFKIALSRNTSDVASKAKNGILARLRSRPTISPHTPPPAPAAAPTSSSSSVAAATPASATAPAVPAATSGSAADTATSQLSTTA